MPTTYCHPSDVAYSHVASLALPQTDHPLPRMLNFGVSNSLPAQYEWNDVISIAKKLFPDAIEEGLLPLSGSVKSIALPFDASKTEEMFGIKLKGFEEMVVDAVEQYCELARKTRR